MGDTYALFIALTLGYVGMVLVGSFADRILVSRLTKQHIPFLVCLAINIGIVAANYFFESEFDEWLFSTDAYSDMADTRQLYAMLALVILFIDITLKYLVYRLTISYSNLKLWLILLIPGLAYTYLWWYFHFG